MEEPTTLLEAVVYFSDVERAHKHFVGIRWPYGIACPRHGCGSADIRDLGSRFRYRCKECKRDFTAKVGTIFEDSPIPLTKWLPAVWLLCNAKNGISSMELHRSLGVTQKTAWFMLHRLRVAFKLRPDFKLGGVVEADETYVGGSLEFKHGRNAMQTGFSDKTPIMGIVERGGQARAWVVPNTKQRTLWDKLGKNVSQDAIVNTDSARAYQTLDEYFLRHDVVNHAIEYVRGQAYTNNIECFWNLLKRSIKGTYICPRPFHLEGYLDEQLFRFNAREDTDSGRFQIAAKLVDGKRLTLKELLAKNPLPKKARRPKGAR